MPASASSQHQRYAHAHQFKRAGKALRKLRTYLGRVIRDIRRRIAGEEDLREAFVRPLYLAERVLSQDRRQRGRKVYSLHAPEVECIGKGKAHKPYEFGVKVSVATTVKHSTGGQFVAHVAALPGNPYYGHTLDGHPGDAGAPRQRARPRHRRRRLSRPQRPARTQVQGLCRRPEAARHRAELMADLFGVKLAAATIARMSRTCAERLRGFAETVRESRGGRAGETHGRDGVSHRRQDAVAACGVHRC